MKRQYKYFRCPIGSTLRYRVSMDDTRPDGVLVEFRDGFKWHAVRNPDIITFACRLVEAEPIRPGWLRRFWRWLFIADDELPQDHCGCNDPECDICFWDRQI